MSQEINILSFYSSRNYLLLFNADSLSVFIEFFSIFRTNQDSTLIPLEFDLQRLYSEKWIFKEILPLVAALLYVSTIYTTNGGSAEHVAMENHP